MGELLSANKQQLIGMPTPRAELALGSARLAVYSRNGEYAG